MSLKERIQTDMKDAMRAKDEPRLGVIRMLRAAIQRREVDEQIELDDAGVVSVVQKLIKQGQDAAGQFDKGGRDDLASKELADIEVLKAYLPEQLSDAEIDTLIADAISETGASGMRDMGKVMGVLKPKLQGRADMGAVSGKIKAKLSG